MKTVQQILNTKPIQVFSVTPATSVLDALQIMTDKNISALLIMTEDSLVGIFTERDYARKIVLQGKSSKDTAISDVMTASPITVTPSDSIELCMQIMTDKHIRHLPIAEGEKVAGMVSIGDVVKFIIADQKQTISQLESYINS
ncbi:CBS domain-containing protein [Pedobacter frigiditerrae]|uniref:CBS domain-containing protein n=1 Tax=Pedobacter frigiditerrae TaxID=2530452 RepID=A0A4R0N3K0_9SPHI|nr:CBS domain-containing protein [Pedobacter frigiditerrae]TCC94448.1 CBS domain-containing protein [Pedobacter frigiditerrae]